MAANPGQLRRNPLPLKPHSCHAPQTDASLTKNDLEHMQFMQMTKFSMRKRLVSYWNKKRLDIKLRHNIPLPHGPLNAQPHSSLSLKLPAEIRLRIYHFALVGANHFLHVIHELPRTYELKRLTHWRCDDVENEHMIWQHACFGQWSKQKRETTHDLRRITDTNSEPLLLLRCCRLM